MRRSQAATRRRARRWLGGFAGAALLGSTVIVSPIIVSPAAADEANADLARFYGQTVTWGPCDDVAGGSECGTVAVPMDYRNPSGRTLDLAVLRILASGNARGSLLVNPGGPGAGGVDFAEYLSTVIDSDVRAVYDIVGFDPRGVGQSAPVTCLTDKQILRWNRTDITPDTARERRTLFSRADRISQGCLDRDPALARSVGTANTVRDMDILRGVLGDDELNWFGFSYGTELGALYAQRFPDRVGRMVLDGAVDPSLNAMEVSEDQSAGFQRALARFASDCAQRSNCIATTQAGVLSAINRLLVQLDQSPLSSDGSRRLVQAEALTAVFFSMYSTDLWPTL
ncbi:MAG: alpha/beta hydrolase, partial [Actinomycetia bacterium]|nr:alpha/beta hydrolase [Actinomycetes bacterium]